jgi:hypothetical protein
MAQKYWRKCRANNVGEIDPWDVNVGKEWRESKATGRKKMKEEKKVP